MLHQKEYWKNDPDHRCGPIMDTEISNIILLLVWRVFWWIKVCGGEMMPLFSFPQLFLSLFLFVVWDLSWKSALNVGLNSTCGTTSHQVIKNLWMRAEQPTHVYTLLKINLRPRYQSSSISLFFLNICSHKFYEFLIFWKDTFTDLRSYLQMLFMSPPAYWLKSYNAQESRSKAKVSKCLLWTNFATITT